MRNAGEAISNLDQGRVAAAPGGLLRSGQPGRTCRRPRRARGRPSGAPPRPGNAAADGRRVQRALAAAELRPDRHGVRRRPAVRRQLPRLQHLSPRRQRRADADQLGRLPGRPGRRVDRRQSPADVGRAGPRAARLRLAGRHPGHQHRTLPRPAHLRHQRHHPPAPGRAGADLSRIAHPFGGQGARGRRPDPRL